MSWIDEVATPDQVSTAKKNVKEDKSMSDDEVKHWMTTDLDSFDSQMCCMLYGQDGSGKSGLVLDFFTQKDVDDGKKVVIIDLDGGNLPLINTYHKSKIKNIFYKNPLEVTVIDGKTETDFVKTFDNIRRIIKWVGDNYKKEKIKFICFDGLSTALKHAENLMRLEKNLDADGGVQLRFWLIRNKIFLDTLDHIKSLPINKFFIAHENFILTTGADKDNSSIVIKTNSMMFQKIRCIREVTKDKVTFKAVIDKSKYNVRQEGREIVFCEVEKNTNNAKWNTEKVFKEIV